MYKLGLIGYPLGHSFSKKFFSEKFKKESIDDFVYENYPIETIAMLPELIAKESSLIGLNVTIPYKQQVMEYLDDVDHVAHEIGAVNTIRIIRRKNEILLMGYNTDAYGFEQPLIQKLKTSSNHKGMILGTGGASKAVAYIFEKHHIDYVFVSRKPRVPEHISYENITNKMVKEYDIIVNTSPVGMYPNVEEKPVLPYEGINSHHIFYDLVYNPLRTAFLKEGEERNAITINGLDMLHLQAQKAWEIWVKDL